MRSLALSLPLSLLNQTSLSLSFFFHHCLLLSFLLLARSLSGTLALFRSSFSSHTHPTLSLCTLIAGGCTSCYGCRAFTWVAPKSCRRVQAAGIFACGHQQILACTSHSHRVVHTCVCVHVCVHVCACVHVCLYMHIYVCVCVCIYTHTHTYVCMYIAWHLLLSLALLFFRLLALFLAR